MDIIQERTVVCKAASGSVYFSPRTGYTESIMIDDY